MNFRDRVLRLAVEAESSGMTDTANALYLLGGMMEPDGSQCRLGEFMVDLINEEHQMDRAVDFNANSDVLGSVAFGVNLSLRLPALVEV